MAFNLEKFTNTVEGKLVENTERYNGYSKELISVIEEIIREENLHQVRATTIKTKIQEICDELGKKISDNETI